MKKLLLPFLLLVNLSLTAQIPNYVTTDSLVAYWPFTGNANDISGHGNNGTVTGATLTVGHTGGGGDAYYFSSAACGTYIQSNINTIPVNTNGAMTLSFWIYRVGDGCLSPRVMEFGSCTTCPGQILINWVNGTNTITLRHYLTATNFITYNFANTVTGKWYHIVYTNDGSTAKYYLNGTLVNTIASPNPVQLQGNTAFGRMNHVANDAFNGNLDDIGLWSRALTDCEVNSLYTGNASSTFAFNPLQDTTVICDSIKLDAGAGFSTYAWSNGTSTQSSIIKTAGWNKITVTNTLGCKAKDSTFISIIKPTVTASKTTVCKGGTVSLSATGVPGSTQTLVDQFTQTFLAPWSHTVNTITGQNYLMVISGTLSDHCVTGDVYNNADAAFFYDRTPIEKVTLSNASSRLFTMWNGSYVRPDGDTYNTSHTYTYTLPVATQNAQLFSYADGGGAGAYGDNCGQMSFQVYNVKKSTATYTWTANPAATAGLNAADIHRSSLTVTPTATTTYYVTVNDGITSCTDSVKITMAMVDTALTVTDPLMVCTAGGTVNLHAAPGQTNYQWLKNGTAITGASNSKDYTATNAGIYRVVVTGSGGCTDTSRAVTVALYPQPVAGFTINNATQCLKGNSFVFTNTSSISSGSITYKWSMGDGSNFVTGDVTYSYILPNNPANPQYTVQLVAISDKGCTDTIRKTVTVDPTPAKPVITAGGSLTVCGSGSVVLTSDAVTGNQWYQNGAAVSGASAKTFTASATGVYTVLSTVNGCTGDSATSIIFTVNPLPATPVITAAGSTSICGTGTVTLNSDALSGNQWYKDGALITGASGKTYTASAAGTYTVIATVNNCVSNASAGTTVSVTPLPPKPIITTDGPVTICEGRSVILSSDAAANNQWYKNGSMITAATGRSYTASTAGIYKVAVSNGCSSTSSDDTVVTIIPAPQNMRYPSVDVQIGSVYPLFARTFGDSYLWTPSAGLSTDTIATPTTLDLTQTQDYLIKITTANGCITYDSLLVKAYRVKGILVPSAFSPNGDGLNDILKAALIDIEKLVDFRIYNRWGQLLFQTSNPAQGWDGTHKGIKQPTGNYIWMATGIDINGKVEKANGQVLIVR